MRFNTYYGVEPEPAEYFEPDDPEYEINRITNEIMLPDITPKLPEQIEDPYPEHNLEDLMEKEPDRTQDFFKPWSPY